MNPKNPQAASEGLQERLLKVVEGLKFNRETHVTWRDWLLASPENERVNPHAGDAKFHDDTIKEYDGHLAAITDAIAALPVPAIAPGGDDPALIVCRRLKSPLLTFIRKHVRFARTFGQPSEPEGDDDFAALQLERALLKADYRIPAPANAGAFDDAMAAVDWLVKQVGGRTIRDELLAKQAGRTIAAALAPAAASGGCECDPAQGYVCDDCEGSDDAPPADPPAAGDVRVVVADLRRLGKEDGWLCATAGADMIEALLAAQEANRG